jgi:hypothetical protein
MIDRRIIKFSSHFELKYKKILITYNSLENGLIPFKKLDKKNTIVKITICVNRNNPK